MKQASIENKALAIFALALSLLACTIGNQFVTVNKMIHDRHASAILPTDIITATETVYIREQPTKSSSPLGILRNGQIVTVGSCFNGWRQVNGGWVNAAYLAHGCGKAKVMWR